MIEIDLRYAENPAEHIARLVKSQSWSPKLVRIEGVSGVGKTTIARKLAIFLDAKHIASDDFLLGKGVKSSHSESMNVLCFQADVRSAISLQSWTIVEGICLEETLPSADFGSGCRLYIKSAGRNLQDTGRASPPMNKLRSIIWHYHRNYDPEAKSDFTVTIE